MKPAKKQTNKKWPSEYSQEDAEVIEHFMAALSDTFEADAFFRILTNKGTGKKICYFVFSRKGRPPCHAFVHFDLRSLLSTITYCVTFLKNIEERLDGALGTVDLCSCLEDMVGIDPVADYLRAQVRYVVEEIGSDSLIDEINKAINGNKDSTTYPSAKNNPSF